MGREQVRRKRVARDYQLVARFYRENPIVEIGLGAKFSPMKISSQYRALMKGDGPKQAIINAMKSLTQFLTAQEFHNFIGNLCIEKELKESEKDENGSKTIAQPTPWMHCNLGRSSPRKKVRCT